MIIVRESTLPIFDITVRERDNYYNRALKNRDKWNYAPQLTLSMLANSDKLKYSIEEFDNTKKSIPENPGIYKYSHYNICSKQKEQFLVWNTFSDGVALLNKKEYDQLLSFKDNDTVIDSDLKSVFRQLGFVVPNEQLEEEIVKHQIYEHSLSRGDTINLIIFPTQDCNARCFYCFEQNEQHIKMSESTVQSTIKYLLNTLDPNKKVVIEWFGGEPLCATDVIDKIVDGLISGFDGKLDFTSKIITNGSLINEEIIKKFKEKWNVKKVQLTIDGHKEEHGKRKAYIDGRKDAYDELLSNIRRLLDEDLFVVCRINLDKKNISQLDAILDDLAEFSNSNRFFVHTSTLRKASKDHNADTPDIEEQYFTPDTFHDFYKVILDKFFEHGIYKSPLNILPMRCRNNCYACSSNTVLISSDGDLYKCEQFSLNKGNSIGNVETGIIMNEAYFSWDKIGGIESECEKCKLLPICNGGCRCNRVENRKSVSPCTRQKYYLDVIFDWIYRLVYKNAE